MKFFSEGDRMEYEIQCEDEYHGMRRAIREYELQHGMIPLEDGRVSSVPGFLGPKLAEFGPMLGDYASLAAVLQEAYDQAARGKGKERHAEKAEAFEKQVICEVRRRVGPGYTKGQAVKKIYESDRLEGERGVAELLGAIVYLAAEIIVRREGR